MGRRRNAEIPDREHGKDPGRKFSKKQDKEPGRELSKKQDKELGKKLRKDPEKEETEKRRTEGREIVLVTCLVSAAVILSGILLNRSKSAEQGKNETDFAVSQEASAGQTQINRTETDREAGMASGYQDADQAASIDLDRQETDQTGMIPGHGDMNQTGTVFGHEDTDQTGMTSTDQAGTDLQPSEEEQAQKVVYLTFDDGPTKENTAAILDILAEKEVKATFFVVGENVRKNPEVARRIVEEGHTIGIHCDRHVYEELYESVDSYLEDFAKAHDSVYEITGVDTRLFRFPGGSVNSFNRDICDDIIETMTEAGYIYFDWNASLEDAVKSTKQEQLVKNAVDTALGRKRIVLLAHDLFAKTVKCLPDLLEAFPDYEFAPLSEAIPPIQFKR